MTTHPQTTTIQISIDGITPEDAARVQFEVERLVTQGIGTFIAPAAGARVTINAPELPGQVAYKLNVEMEYGGCDGTRLDYLLFATREEMEAARIELENDIFDHSDITVFESSPVEVVLGKGDELHSGPLKDVEFVQEMREHLGLDDDE